jgi:glycosyltransferase involved in cell wall biosynthesis
VASADSPLKGVAILLRAFAKLVTDRDVTLTVVSKPTPGGTTEKLVSELSLHDRVRFVSGLTDRELADLIASAEIAVVPSLYEGFSLPALEHMACGTPLIASRVGALPEIADQAALIIAPGDIEELAAGLRRLHDSPQERAVLSESAVLRVQERFTWTAVARATEKEYFRILAER